MVWSAHPSHGWVGTELLDGYTPAGDVTVGRHPAGDWQWPPPAAGGLLGLSPSAMRELAQGPPF